MTTTEQQLTPNFPPPGKHDTSFVTCRSNELALFQTDEGWTLSIVSDAGAVRVPLPKCEDLRADIFEAYELCRQATDGSFPVKVILSAATGSIPAKVIALHGNDEHPTSPQWWDLSESENFIVDRPGQ